MGAQARAGPLGVEPDLESAEEFQDEVLRTTQLSGRSHLSGLGFHFLRREMLGEEHAGEGEFKRPAFEKVTLEVLGRCSHGVGGSGSPFYRCDRNRRQKHVDDTSRYRTGCCCVGRTWAEQGPRPSAAPARPVPDGHSVLSPLPSGHLENRSNDQTTHIISQRNHRKL